MAMLQVAGARRRAHAKRTGRRRTFAWLHLRARSAPVTLAGLVAVALAGWLLADWLVHREWSNGPTSRLLVVVAAPLLATALVGRGLAGGDEEVERSTSLRWWLVRLLHVGLGTGLAAAVLAVIGLWEPRVYGAFELARNTMGFFGLLMVAVVVLGVGLAWIVPFGYAVVAPIAMLGSLTESTAWWTWPAQPSSEAPAAWAALAWFTVGAVAYVVRGSRPRPHDPE